MSISVFVCDSSGPRRARAMGLIRAQADMQLVGDSERAADCLSAIANLKPDIALLDLDVPRPDSQQWFAAMRNQSPHTKVIVMIRQDSEERVIESLSFGALGWLTNRRLASHLPQAIRKVHGGEVWLPRRLASQVLERVLQLSSLS